MYLDKIDVSRMAFNGVRIDSQLGSTFSDFSSLWAFRESNLRPLLTGRQITPSLIEDQTLVDATKLFSARAVVLEEVEGWSKRRAQLLQHHQYYTLRHGRTRQLCHAEWGRVIVIRPHSTHRLVFIIRPWHERLSAASWASAHTRSRPSV